MQSNYILVPEVRDTDSWFIAFLQKTKAPSQFLRRCLIQWEQRESNPRPSACKADALNQLSYAPEKELFLSKRTANIRPFSESANFIYWFPIFMTVISSKVGNLFKKCTIFAPVQWGCFGFDSIRHWTVSTSGVGGLPVNLSFRTISWQQLLCTRCVVC